MEIDIGDIQKEASKFRKQKIEEEPNTEMGKFLREEMIEIERDDTSKKSDKLRIMLGETYEKILESLKYYSDLKDRDYQIITLWIIGTYFHKEFLTYPYLFLNAMKGSGKSRTLRLIVTLSWNGQLLGSIREAGLFRTAGKGTIGLDEFEGVSKKENSGLREVLNAGYKKGLKIVRMKKQKTPFGEEQVPEYFEPYTPIVMANIWGMEEVLGDRCIISILEKSNKPKFILKMEDFDNDILIKNIKNDLNLLKNTNLVKECSYFSVYNIYKQWNRWVETKYNNTTTLTTLNTQIPLTTLRLESFFNKIVETGLTGRDLELYMPLFIVAKILNEDILEKILKISKETTKEKRVDEITDSKDVQLIEFVSTCETDVFYKLKDLTNKFKLFSDYDEKDEYSNWMNPKWMGRALKRLELIIQKRRLGMGNEVILNIRKAQEKIKIFR